MVGLKGAGANTLMKNLSASKEERPEMVPKVGWLVESLSQQLFVTSMRLEIFLFMAGGRDRSRPVLRRFTEHSAGIVLVVDCTAENSLEEVAQGLTYLLEQENLVSTPLLVYANKQDVPKAMGPSEVADALGLPDIHDRPWHVQGAVATSGDGVQEGWRWLSSALTSHAASELSSSPGSKGTGRVSQKPPRETGVARSAHGRNLSLLSQKADAADSPSWFESLATRIYTAPSLKLLWL